MSSRAQQIETRVGALRGDPAFATLRRSFEIYYGDARHDAAMDRLYGRFLSHGDLAFDVGAHVGGRIAAFRRLGARVIAIEPQPLCAVAIRQIYLGDESVEVLGQACGAEPGTLTLHVNTANPTVTTVSKAFMHAADGAGGWEGQEWDAEIRVPVTTLDLLVAEFGSPAFVKIDVEGFEEEVLRGLSTPIPALSFEFTTIQRGVALRCLDRLVELGPYRFDIALGESQMLTFSTPVLAETMAEHLRGLPHDANSGDVYAILPQ